MKHQQQLLASMNNPLAPEIKPPFKKRPRRVTDETYSAEMPFDTKRTLATALNCLNSTKLGKVVSIVRKAQPGFGKGCEDAELDINSLDNCTLWRLHAFMESNKPKPKPKKKLANNLQHSDTTMPTTPVGIQFADVSVSDSVSDSE